MNKAINDVIAERKRQIEVEGWTAEHDDQHTDRSLAAAAACYAYGSSLDDYWRGIMTEGLHGYALVQRVWPQSWHQSWWKPKDRRRDLVRAAALLIAEIERLDRTATGGDG